MTVLRWYLCHLHFFRGCNQRNRVCKYNQYWLKRIIPFFFFFLTRTWTLHKHVSKGRLSLAHASVSDGPSVQIISNSASLFFSAVNQMGHRCARVLFLVLLLTLQTLAEGTHISTLMSTKYCILRLRVVFLSLDRLDFTSICIRVLIWQGAVI